MSLLPFIGSPCLYEGAEDAPLVLYYQPTRHKNSAAQYTRYRHTKEQPTLVAFQR